MLACTESKVQADKIPQYVNGDIVCKNRETLICGNNSAEMR